MPPGRTYGSLEQSTFDSPILNATTSPAVFQLRRTETPPATDVRSSSPPSWMMTLPTPGNDGAMSSYVIVALLDAALTLPARSLRQSCNVFRPSGAVVTTNVDVVAIGMYV